MTVEDQPQLSVVLPVYNEGEAVAPIIRALVSGIHWPCEIPVVYDFDEDTTVPVARALASELPAVKPLAQRARPRGPQRDEGRNRRRTSCRRPSADNHHALVAVHPGCPGEPALRVDRGLARGDGRVHGRRDRRARRREGQTPVRPARLLPRLRGGRGQPRLPLPPGPPTARPIVEIAAQPSCRSPRARRSARRICLPRASSPGCSRGLSTPSEQLGQGVGP